MTYAVKKKKRKSDFSVNAMENVKSWSDHTNKEHQLVVPLSQSFIETIASRSGGFATTKNATKLEHLAIHLWIRQKQLDMGVKLSSPV